MIVEYEQIRLDLVAMEKPIEELGIALDIDGAKENIAKLEKETLEPDFYNDIKNSQKVLQKIKEFTKSKAKIKEYLKARNVQNAHFMTNVQKIVNIAFSMNPPTL